jgi:hypothetical protein
MAEAKYLDALKSVEDGSANSELTPATPTLATRTLRIVPEENDTRGNTVDDLEDIRAELSSTTYAQPQPQDTIASQQNGQSNLVAQEVNGMIYYYDPSQISAVATLPVYSALQQYPMQQVNMGGMRTPSPDGFYYPAPPQGVVYGVSPGSHF